jgi:hypothetical protein
MGPPLRSVWEYLIRRKLFTDSHPTLRTGGNKAATEEMNLSVYNIVKAQISLVHL